MTNTLRLIRAYIAQLMVDRAAGNTMFMVLIGFLPLALGSTSTGWYYYGAAVLVFFALKSRLWPQYGLPPLSLFAVVAVLVTFVADLLPRIILPNGENRLIYLFNSAQFLIFPLVLLGLWRTAAVDYLRLFIMGLRYAPLCALPVAMVQALCQVERPSGLLGNALPFADLALLCALLSLLLVDWRNRRQSALAIAALFCGFACVLLAQARGPLLTLPLLLPVLGFYLVRQSALGLKHMAAMVMGLVLVLAIALSFSTLGNRLHYLIGATEIVQGNGQNAKVSESETERLVMWRYGMKVAREHFWLGIGPQNRPQAVQDMARADGQAFPRHTHLHNEYLTTLVDKGLFGLVALILLLLAPVVTAFRAPRDGRFLARVTAAIIVSSGYSIFGMTNLAFGHDILNTFYCASLLAICLSAAQSEAGIQPSAPAVQRISG